MVKTLKKITIILFIAAAFIAIAQDAFSQEIVRVAVFRDVPGVSLTSDGPFVISSVSDSGELFKALSGKDLMVRSSSQGFNASGETIREEQIEIKRLDSGFLSINSRNFRGKLRFVKINQLTFCVVNYLDLEDYIKGVLYHEISHLWPAEVIKAQAIAVRSFALSQIKQKKDKDFDLTNDVFSQMYGGRTSERWRTNKAIEDTKGEILTFNGQALPAYYHATCAGFTEDANLVWGVDLAPLKGVACSFCKNSPHWRWTATVSLKGLEKKLKAAGFKVSNIKTIEVDQRLSSGRVGKLNIIFSSGSINVSGKQLREIIGPNTLRSTNFKAKIKGNSVLFDGFGWGHGVGLCQWGAYFMAKKGFTHQEILQHYYPAAEIEKMSSQDSANP